MTDRLATVCRLLNEAGARYVVVGAFAAALHGVVRATKDVDILIEPTVENARKVLEAFEGLRWGVSRDFDAAEVATRLVTVIGDDPRVDVLTVAWSVRYADAVPGMLTAIIDDVDVPYPDLATLIRTKQTDRLQDRADLERLEEVRRLAQGE